MNYELHVICPHCGRAATSNNVYGPIVSYVAVCADCDGSFEVTKLPEVNRFVAEIVPETDYRVIALRQRMAERDVYLKERGL